MRLGSKRCILIYLGAILLMSHIISNNVHAFEFNQNVFFKKRAMASTLWWQDNNDGTTWRNGSKTYGAQYTNSGATFFRLSNNDRTFDVYNHDIIVITGTFAATSSLGGTINTAGMMSIGAENLQCPIIDITADTEEVDNGISTDIYTYRKNFTITCVMAGDNTSYVAMNLNINNAGQNLVDHMYIQFKSMYVFERDTSLWDIFTWLQQNQDDAGATLQQEKQDVQDASDNSETVADNNSENAATTNLIGAFSSLLSALTSLSATNCNVTLPFPSALGGNMTVNICQNKDYAGNIISVFGSLTLCVFYVPLALKLLSMIYNEIRSFTNG